MSKVYNVLVSPDANKNYMNKIKNINFINDSLPNWQFSDITFMSDFQFFVNDEITQENKLIITFFSQSKVANIYMQKITK